MPDDPKKPEDKPSTLDERLTWKEGDLELPKGKPKGKTLAQMDEEHADEGGEPLIESDGPTVHVYLPEEGEG